MKTDAIHVHHPFAGEKLETPLLTEFKFQDPPPPHFLLHPLPSLYSMIGPSALFYRLRIKICLLSQKRIKNFEIHALA